MSVKINDRLDIRTVKDERGTLGFFEFSEECKDQNCDIILFSKDDDESYELHLGKYQYVYVAVLRGSLQLQDIENKSHTMVLDKADTLSIIEGNSLVNIMSYCENTAVLLFCYRKNINKLRLYSVDDCTEIKYAHEITSHKQKGVYCITNPPFSIKRFYYIKDVSQRFDRGHHAHKDLLQLFFAMNGKYELFLDDGKNKRSTLVKDNGNSALVGPGIWREIRSFSENAICLVLASEKYDEDDYIRNYEEFLVWRNEKQGAHFYEKEK